MKNIIDLISEKISYLKTDLEYVTSDIEITESYFKRDKEEREGRIALIDECKKAIEIKGK